VSLPKREFSKPAGLPISVDELFGVMRLRGFNAANFPTNVLLENDGTMRSQLILWDGTAQKRAQSDDNGTQFVGGGRRKCLGSSAPAATTETVLYTVPAGKSAYVHSIWICNRGAIETTRVGVSVGGGALATDDYVMFNVVVPGADTLSWASERMWCLAATDEVRVRSSAGNLTYKIFGEEA